MSSVCQQPGPVAEQRWLFKGSAVMTARGKRSIAEVITGSTSLTPFRAKLPLLKLDDNRHSEMMYFPRVGKAVFTIEGNSRQRSAQ